MKINPSASVGTVLSLFLWQHLINILLKNMHIPKLFTIRYGSVHHSIIRIQKHLVLLQTSEMSLI